MYARIVGGIVAEITAVMPKLEAGECAHIEDCGEDVQPGYAWSPAGFVPPIVGPNDLIDAQIAGLEAQQTPRRLREAALTEEGKLWLQNLENQIAALRAQRV